MTETASREFLDAYSRLIVSQLHARLGSLFGTDIDTSEVRLLLQTAAIFAFDTRLEDEAKDRRAWAYDVATRLVEAFGSSNRTVIEAVDVILMRLGNFPGRTLLRERWSVDGDQHGVKSLCLDLEALAREAENTIEYPKLGELLLTDFQYRLTESIRRSRGVSVSAPTSAGKSFVLAHEIVTSVATQPGRVVVYLVPTRALIQQVVTDLLRLCREAELEGVVVSAAPIDFNPEKTQAGLIYVLTQERLVSLLNNPDFSQEIHQLFVDEAQGIGDSDRGLILDSAIREVLARSPKVRTCFASPLTRNPGYVLGQFRLEDEGEYFTELSSPVSQVLVNVRPVEKKTRVATFSVETPVGTLNLDEIKLPFKFRNVRERLAGLARFVRKPGESVIVFANRPIDAMETAEVLAEKADPKAPDAEVTDLVKFIKGHVHPKYSLAETLTKGVAFHYGRMPHIIRKRVEDLLREKKLNYVVATSTLLQGVNLPAQHIVVLNPKSGSTPMQAPDFWNLVGRAGRLRENFRGFVWCVDPENWEASPFTGDRLSEIKSAFVASMEDSTLRNLAASVLDGTTDLYDLPNRNAVEQFIGKAFCEFTLEDKLLSESDRVPAEIRKEMQPIETRLETLKGKLAVPVEVCALNPTIAPMQLEALWRRFTTSMSPSMIPLDPYSSGALDNLRGIYKTIEDVFIRAGNERWKYFAPLTFFWVMGKSLRELIADRLEYNNVNSSDTNAVNANIRELLDAIESTIRFTYVRYLGAYLDVLRAYLTSEGQMEEAETIPPWDLYVEFGARDRVLLMLMSLGVSRSTAVMVRSVVTKENDISREDCYARLNSLNLQSLDIPELCKDELKSLIGQT